MTKQTDTFIYNTILNHIVWYPKHPELAQRTAELYNVDLAKFKEEHSGEILFALLKK